MKKSILTVLLFLPVVTMLGCAVSGSPTPSRPAPSVSEDLASLATYRQWTLVNPTPQLMEPAAAHLCGRVIGREEGSPHLNKYISVYVNPVGREAMMTKVTPKFPVGSMIVKEKLGSADSTTPELLTAMIKREAGYNPDSGDWEYLALDGSASKIVAQGKLTQCSVCHKSYEYSDFVTRVYLPDKVSRELKP